MDVDYAPTVKGMSSPVSHSDAHGPVAITSFPAG